ncbi:C40 family peptidase [Clostridium sp. BJN0001]|uniref:C40 family peptidase n=1 Tax=Clostridium sp. BJN0001 TaxID=2930219 RepID=UPI001FD45306|nr:C40 family peptidase [Clostridium sp. BJN0001]
MKNKILAVILAAMTAMTVMSVPMPVLAEPDSGKLSQTRQKYAEIEQKIQDIQDKIYDLDSQIEPLQVTVDKNNKEIEDITSQIENNNKDIEQCKVTLNNLDLALGKRVKAMYSSGDLEANYLNYLFESESTSDFFGRVQAISTIVRKDKESISKIEDKNKELDDKINTLNDKKDEIDKLNSKVQSSLEDLDSKKEEQQTLIEQAKDERDKFDTEYLSQIEEEVVKPQFAIIDSSSSTSSDINAAISQLRSIRDNQLKSPTVITEVNEKIEKAKVTASQKQQEETAASINRSASKAQAATASSGSVSAPNAGNAQAVLNEAYRHLGTPYVWGATGPTNFDCSGFTQYVYKKATGIDISRTTYSQINVGQAVSRSELQPGDLVFPHSGHVGIYVGNGQMIHAPQTGDVVKVSTIGKFYAARRIL